MIFIHDKVLFGYKNYKLKSCVGKQMDFENIISELNQTQKVKSIEFFLWYERLSHFLGAKTKYPHTQVIDAKVSFSLQLMEVSVHRLSQSMFLLQVHAAWQRAGQRGNSPWRGRQEVASTWPAFPPFPSLSLQDANLFVGDTHGRWGWEDHAPPRPVLNQSVD